MSETAQYELPEGDLGLKGPVNRPEPGTLPLRGDLAHIALADRYLVPHYVVPQFFEVAATSPLKLTADSDGDTVAELAAGSTFEVLDYVGEWYWGCVTAEGPSGYVPKDALVSQEA